MRRIFTWGMALVALEAMALDHKGISSATAEDGAFAAIKDGCPAVIVADPADQKGVSIAVSNLSADFGRVCGTEATVLPDLDQVADGQAHVIVGTLESKIIKQLAKEGVVDAKQLLGAVEKYLMIVDGNRMVIAGSDRRGAIYGIYELSEQLGVSPWYFWADVPVAHRDQLYIKAGTYTAGEPAVRYRGIFLNDEAPCLTSWVLNHYGTNHGGKAFYADVFELILRLRGNFLWPAMWGWAFYADDPDNSRIADEMGVVMGTSHHEPMARNHQEWARRRGADGPWDYARNKDVIDQFFREGIERSRDNEDLITIGMRGDGDAPMGGEEGKDHEYVARDQENMRLLEDIIDNQRRIIQEVTGRPAKERQQVWALYKEVQKFYEMGLRVPDDVIILLSDDNWGDVRRLPNAQERKRKGGWGMYYHVDYVGAPRNTKWLNVTPIQNLWEQMTLAYEYGVDKLWVLNVGDLKPMEYPITLFLDLAWNPKQFTAETLLGHATEFFAQLFGTAQAQEAARIFNLYSKYAGRVTPEMLDASTYNLSSGEWTQVRNEWMQLEAEALRQYLTLDPAQRDAYMQLILFPVQALGNLYDMYYSVAMNNALAAAGNPDCNAWAQKAEEAFLRDKDLHHIYNKVMADGKWDGMMTQKHIGYKTWNDNFPADVLPAVYRIDDAAGGNVFGQAADVMPIEAEHYYSAQDAAEACWTVIPYMGRTLSGITLMPRMPEPKGACLSYKLRLPVYADSVEVMAVTKSTLAFANPDGHRYTLAFEGGESEMVNFNGDLNEQPQNIYDVYYPTVASRVVEKTVTLPVTRDADGYSMLMVAPLDPGIVFEKFVISVPGAYQDARLHHPEAPRTKQ